MNLVQAATTGIGSRTAFRLARRLPRQAAYGLGELLFDRVASQEALAFTHALRSNLAIVLGLPEERPGVDRGGPGVSAFRWFRPDRSFRRRQDHGGTLAPVGRRPVRGLWRIRPASAGNARTTGEGTGMGPAMPRSVGGPDPPLAGRAAHA